MILFKFLSNVDWTSFINAMKDLILPITSLIFSTFAFYVSFSEKKNKKFNLKINFFSDSEEWLIDRDSNDTPDVYFNCKYRLIESVILTNNSSLPVTITRFSISDIKEEINPFTHFGDDYSVTIISPKKRMPKGGIAYSGNELKKVADFSTFPPLKLPITIGPYQSVVTSLIFRYNKPLISKTIDIVVSTSRGTKTFKRFVSSSQISQLVTDYVPPQSDKLL